MSSEQLPGFVRRACAGCLCLAAIAAIAAPSVPRSLARQGERTGPESRTLDVKSAVELAAALRSARPGDTIRVAPGDYAGGIASSGPRGSAERPIRVVALDPAKPPRIRGGACALQLTDAEFVELSDLVIEGQSGNGINLDDGGSPDTPARGLRLVRLTVRDIGRESGSRGNCDGIKLSGVIDFSVEECVVERWGGGGSAIDMVGCRDGRIEKCRFECPPGAQPATGVQAKGGSRDIAIRRSRFVHAGSRAINAGGSTGLEYFRPPLESWEGERFEAKDLLIEGNVFVGSDAPIALVGIDGARVCFNTVVRPGRWFLRLLQETRAEGFVPARNARIESNLIVFTSDVWREGGFNVGPGTEPGSLRFSRNVWTALDAPERSRGLVRPPGSASDERFGLVPRFVDAEHGDFAQAPDSPTRDVGADGLGSR